MTAERLVRAWNGWAGLWARRESPRVLAIVRILVALVLLYDFVSVWALDLVPILWGTSEAGGIGDVLNRKSVPELYRWFPPTAGTVWGAWGVMVTALACLALGFLTPVAALVALVISSQLAQVLPMGDRGIDLMMRNVLLLLALSGCGRAFSVDARLFTRGLGLRLFGARDTVQAWPRHLLVLQVLVMYFAAGIQKTSVTWWPLGGYGALYLILQDPSIAAFRFGWLERIYPLTQLAGVGTMVFELGAGPILLAWWFRDTRLRGGRLRALYNRLDLRRLWMGVGVLLHLGIAVSMSLGIFPYAMLALYPAFFHPDELPRRLRGARTERLPSEAAA